MKIRWYGHSCFVLETEGGVRILTDPYNSTIGYPMHELDVDIVTISHEHHDHNERGMAMGNPLLLCGEGQWDCHGIRITGIASSHDSVQGQERGMNTIFLFEAEGMTIAHLGDLGEIPCPNTIAKLQNVDILFAPVGGVYTIGPKEACQIANLIHTSVLIPMHYQTSVLALKKQLLHVNELIAIAKDCRIHKLNQSDCVITRDNLGEDRVLVLDYARE